MNAFRQERPVEKHWKKPWKSFKINVSKEMLQNQFAGSEPDVLRRITNRVPRQSLRVFRHLPLRTLD
jgi:hypothetical protein